MSNCNGDTTKKVCGDFTEPSNPDQGSCFPYRLKPTCEAPTIPEPECDDETEAVYDPETGTFTILSTLFDENCSAILDENSSPILTPIT